MKGKAMQLDNHRMRPALAAPLRGNYCESYATESHSRPTSLQMMMKDVFDRGVALAGLIVAAPIMAVVAILVRCTSSGPAIYAQLRIGYHGKLFHCYKFRSMYHNCEKTSGAVWAARNDSRITPLGKILRATYLDELPQLFNVLMGEMSLVGPRPERPEITAKLRRQFPHDYYKRLLVKPGITGLAQINQHSDLDIADVRRKLHYDLLYVRQMSLWLDIKTIIGTVSPIVTRSHQSPQRRRSAAAGKAFGAPAPHIAIVADNVAVADSQQIGIEDTVRIDLSACETQTAPAIKSKPASTTAAQCIAT